MTERPAVTFIDTENGFVLIGQLSRTMLIAGWDAKRRQKVMKELTAGDLDHLLEVAEQYFEVTYK